jgi:DNA-binding LytR/AlgR family response regulator
VLKPVQTERLAKTCARLQERLLDRKPPRAAVASLDAVVDQMRELLAAGRPEPSRGMPAAAPLRVIQASAGNTITMVPVDDILFFEAADKYIRVVTADREHLIRLSLRELLPQLDPQRFWQIHRGAVVRCEAIETAQRDDAGKLTLTLRGNPGRLVVSRLYAHLFRGM